MEQLVMQTQQAAAYKPKLSAKKPSESKDKQSDFGKALEEQAASYVQASTGSNDNCLQVQQPESVGTSGIQVNGIVDALAFQNLTAVQGENLLKQEQLTVQGETLMNESSAQMQMLSEEQLGAEAVVQQNSAVNSEIPMQNVINSEEVKTENSDSNLPKQDSAIAEVTAEAAIKVNGVQKQEAPVTEENAEAGAAKTGDKSDAVVLQPISTQQEYWTSAVKAEGTQKAASSSEMKPEYADMLKDMIAKQVSNGRNELEIKLTPRSLGELTVKVAYHDGAAVVSIICSERKALQAMSQKAGELGMIIENNLGTRTDVVVETREESSRLYQDGRGQQSYQGQQESEQQGKKQNETETVDFLQQLRLGIRKESESIWQ